MKDTFSILAFMALFGHLAVAERWEIFPLTPSADISTFNTTTWDATVWNVTHLPDPTSVVEAIGTDDCSAGQDPNMCLPNNDGTTCNIAIRIPQTDDISMLADSWVYTNDCSRIRGCKTDCPRGGVWWSIYSDLKYTVEACDNQVFHPYVDYADYRCQRLCEGWSYVVQKIGGGVPDNYIFRKSFPCGQA